MITKDQILAALPHLDHTALKAIRAAADTLAGEGGKAGHPNDPTGYGAWLLEALNHFSGAPLSKVGKKAFDKNSLVAINFMRKYFEKPMSNKTTASALMRYLVTLLANDLKEMKLPVTRNTLSFHLHRIQEVFEKNFPGYGDGKAAALIATSLLRK